ncbi:hypothetical protein B0H19DRAFT_1275249 [Mycena capillaripes]|nr:hypothetical protein B0H19DRAFT_1275249 [Mycena capillaripes]
MSSQFLSSSFHSVDKTAPPTPTTPAPTLPLSQRYVHKPLCMHLRRRAYTTSRSLPGSTPGPAGVLRCHHTVPHPSRYRPTFATTLPNRGPTHAPTQPTLKFYRAIAPLREPTSRIPATYVPRPDRTTAKTTYAPPPPHATPLRACALRRYSDAPYHPTHLRPQHMRRPTPLPLHALPKTPHNTHLRPLCSESPMRPRSRAPLLSLRPYLPRTYDPHRLFSIHPLHRRRGYLHASVRHLSARPRLPVYVPLSATYVVCVYVPTHAVSAMTFYLRASADSYASILADFSFCTRYLRRLPPPQRVLDSYQHEDRISLRALPLPA